MARNLAGGAMIGVPVGLIILSRSWHGADGDPSSA